MSWLTLKRAMKDFVQEETEAVAIELHIDETEGMSMAAQGTVG